MTVGRRPQSRACPTLQDLAMTTIPSITSQPLTLPTLSGASEPSQADAASFQNLLASSLEETAALEHASQSAIGRSLSGDDITQVEVFSAVKKADLALRMMLQIRNKTLEAYDEIKRMQM